MGLAKAARECVDPAAAGFVTPEDVKSIAYDVLRHRILLTFEAEAEGIDPDRVVRSVLERVEVP